MMDRADHWMNGSLGGGMGIWPVIGILLAVLLVVAIRKLSRK